MFKLFAENSYIFSLVKWRFLLCNTILSQFAFLRKVKKFMLFKETNLRNETRRKVDKLSNEYTCIHEKKMKGLENRLHGRCMIWIRSNETPGGHCYEICIRKDGE